MKQFPDASSYCQHIKSLSNQLSNVGAPVSNERVVLQLVSGLFDAYATVGSKTCHSEILPPFYKAQPMVVLEETTLSKHTQNNTNNFGLLLLRITILPTLHILALDETKTTPPTVTTNLVA